MEELIKNMIREEKEKEVIKEEKWKNEMERRLEKMQKEIEEVKEREKERDLKMEKHEKDWWKLMEMELGGEEYASLRSREYEDIKKERDWYGNRKEGKEAARDRSIQAERKREEKSVGKEETKEKREETRRKREEEEEASKDERSEDRIRELEAIGWIKIEGTSQWVQKDIMWLERRENNKSSGKWWDNCEERREKERQEEGREAKMEIEGDKKEEESQERGKESAEEREYEERRKRRVIWQGMEGKNESERKGIIEGIIEKILREKGMIKKMEERSMEKGRYVIITELMAKEERDKILERRTEIWKRWDISVREDLTYKERELKWRITRKAKQERLEGKEVRWNERRLWINEEEWIWRGAEKKWEKKEDVEKKVM